MNESSLARRYSRALVQTLAGEKDFQAAKRQLSAFQQFLAADPELKTALTTFLLPLEKKREAVALAGRELLLADNINRFLQVLLEENRLGLLHLVIGQMDELWCEALGVERVTVYSAVPLDAGQKLRLRKNLEKLWAKEVAIQNEIAPRLLAGIEIQRGSVHYDFSLLGNLERLREQISEEK